MAQVVHLVCARCGHPEMHVVESAENQAPSADRVPGAEDTSTLEAIRLQRLKFLPTSLPVGGIITPV